MSQTPTIRSNKAARLVAVQCIYNYHVSDNQENAMYSLLSDLQSNWESKKYYETKYKEFNLAYTKLLISDTISHLELIDTKISQFLLEKWTIEQLPAVVLSILRVAVAEIIRGDHDSGIIITEYLAITHSLNHDKESGFIHSVLDKIAKLYKK